MAKDFDLLVLQKSEELVAEREKGIVKKYKSMFERERKQLE